MLLDEEHVWCWLDGAEMAGSAPGVEISCHPVTTRVGNTRHDDSELIMPVELMCWRKARRLSCSPMAESF